VAPHTPAAGATAGDRRTPAPIFHPTEDLHGYLAYTLFALIGIHVLAVLWHQFMWRDRLLRRMWPTTAPEVRSRP